MEDNQLLELLWKRDETVLDEMSSKYKNYCYSISYNIVRDSEDAAECVNDTWLGAWNSIPPNRPKQLKTYLGKITRNISIKRWDEKNTIKRGGGQVPLALEELTECIPSNFSLEKTVQMTELVQMINQFLIALPKNEMKVFICRYWYLDSVKTIAEQFGFSQSKVKSMLFRTRKKMVQYLESRGVIDET